MPVRPIPCAGAVVVDDGRLLLVQRGHDPGRGLWSVPGGRCAPGEHSAAACVREVAEETGLAVSVDRLLGTVERSGTAGTTLVIDDYACALRGGHLRPGDDADDARWVGRLELDDLPLVPQLMDCLREWGVLELIQPG